MDFWFWLNYVWFVNHWWVWLIAAVICGLIAEEIGVSKRRSFVGSFAWGFFLGILGIVIVALLPRGVAPPPRGTATVKCTRCNAEQNILIGATSFECWQCKTPIHVVVQS
ncbi:hypothetical protein [Mycolicibacterium sp. HS_4_1]